MDHLEDLIGNEDAKTIAIFAVYLKHLAANLKITPEIYEEVQNISNTREAKSMLVTTLGEIRNEGKIEGKAEGKIEERSSLIISMYKNKLSITEISRYTNVDEIEVRKIIETQHIQ